MQPSPAPIISQTVIKSHKEQISMIYFKNNEKSHKSSKIIHLKHQAAVALAGF